MIRSPTASLSTSSLIAGMRRMSVAKRWLIACGAAVLLLPSAASAACPDGWDLSGPWELDQGNSISTFLIVEQDGDQLSGTAKSRSSGGNASNTSGFAGRIDGDSFSFMVDWGGLVGVYRGTIDGQGRMRGTTYDESDPASQARWTVPNDVATCLDQAETPEVLLEEPALGLGKVKPVLNLGKVELPAGAEAPEICDAAKSARKRGSPATPGLEAQCEALQATQQVSTTTISQDDLDEFAELGRSLIRKDRLAIELRRRQGQGAGQFGFEVGIGSTDKDTAPGPGKNRVGEALSPAEKQGFEVAMAYALERNRNLKLARVGAAIAREDDDVQEARTADRDVFYWLGFDIATAIYGDPALGAQGNTAEGKGAWAIRDALVSAAAQQGFRDAVAFHLARTY